MTNTKDAYLRIIFNDLAAGRKYGNFINNVRYPYFDVNLVMDNKYIHWRHYGSSANKATLTDLLWVIEHIFEQTPEQFYKTHYVEN